MKKRIFQLAKEFGMKSSDMVELLQRMGFDSVKGSQSTLPEDKEMQAIAQLQLYFEKRNQQSAPAEEAKPKKKLLPGAEPEAEEQEAAAATAAEPEHRELPKKQLPKSGPGLRKLPPKRPGDAEAPAAEAEAAEAAAHAHDRHAHESHAHEGGAAAVAPAPAAPHVPPPTPAAPPPAPVEHHKPPAEVHLPPAEKPAAAATPTPPSTAPAEPPAARDEPAKIDDDVKRLIVPQPKAKVLRRIELPAETIRDATRRSAPTSDRDLRRAALAKTQLRSASRTAQPANRRQPQGPGQSRGPGRDSGRGGPQKRGKTAPATVDPNKIVEIEAPFSVKSISEALGVKVTDLIAKLTFKLGITGKNINSYLTQEEVELVALELDRKVSIVEHKEAEEQMFEQIGAAHGHQEELLRAPVVTFMGHVDHGKTSLLDALRSSDVAKHEAGGITQHIGAYKVTNAAGHSIVILDTPGHAAFSAMRARGANLTDVVVLVVAADDGVKPQTEEAISHAKAANVPIVVAINKCDLPSANPMQVKQQLMIKGLQSEEWGGSTQMVEVSALKRTGLDDLVERIMLETEMMELKARPDAPGRGIVVESRQTPEQGVVVTVLVTDGTIRTKDQVVCGESFSRVRGLIDDHGRTVQEAGPSTPVTLLGLDRLPMPGDKLFIVEDAKKAREVVEERQRRARELNLAERSAVTLETLSAKLAEKDIQEIKMILKADVMGSLEPLRKCIAELTTPEVRVNLIHSALGGISETDVSLAAASGAVIVGFNMVADSSARAAAEKAGVEIRYYDVIYDLLDSLKAAMEGLLKPQEIENILGHAEVRAVFKSSKFGLIAGCYVTDGIVKRNAKVRLTRESRVVYTGKVASLRREKDDVKDVRAGFECGMTLQDYQDIKEGDILEFSQVELVKRTLA